MNWTGERIELLKNFWGEGISASQIAKQLGGVTRSAVLGKLNRLKLTRKDGNVGKSKSKPGPAKGQYKAPSKGKTPEQQRSNLPSHLVTQSQPSRVRVTAAKPAIPPSPKTLAAQEAERVRRQRAEDLFWKSSSRGST